MIETTPTPNEYTTWKSFHVGDILSIITGVMVCPEGMDGVYKILNWMTSDELFTHQLLRASQVCEPILKDLYPGIAALEVPNASNVAKSDQESFWKAWLDVQVETFGEMLPVPKIDTYAHIDPIQEFFDRTGKNPIVVVADDEDLETKVENIVKEVLEQNENLSSES